MTILVTGSEGQLGSELRLILKNAVFLKHGIIDDTSIDISEEESVAKAFAKYDPKIVINTAAYNDVDGAERYPQLAFKTNATGTRNLVVACDMYNAQLIHISTDYVFGRDERVYPYPIYDKPDPVNVYGVSKMVGEEFIKMSERVCKHTIIRTCGLYSCFGRTNFIKKILARGTSEDAKHGIQVVNNQYCSP